MGPVYKMDGVRGAPSASSTTLVSCRAAMVYPSMHTSILPTPTATPATPATCPGGGRGGGAGRGPAGALQAGRRGRRWVGHWKKGATLTDDAGNGACAQRVRTCLAWWGLASLPQRASGSGWSGGVSERGGSAAVGVTCVGRKRETHRSREREHECFFQGVGRGEARPTIDERRTATDCVACTPTLFVEPGRV